MVGGAQQVQHGVDALVTRPTLVDDVPPRRRTARRSGSAGPEPAHLSEPLGMEKRHTSRARSESSRSFLVCFL